MNIAPDSETLVGQIADDVLRMVQERRRPRGSTYRLQFNKDFTFRQAAEIVPYLHRLGITHVYASPYLKARPGSAHGYDVCDHNELNPELGTTDDFAAFVSALRRHDMGMVLDVVPNHMSASHYNAWWYDVLENGPNSPYAYYFDIDWRPIGELANKVLLPILGEQYGDVLESGQLQMEHVDGGFTLKYYDTILPIGPETSIPVLTHRIEELRQALGEGSEAFGEYQSIITALEHLPAQTATSPQQVEERQREKEVIKRRLRRLEAEQPIVADFITRNVQDFNGRPGEPASFDRLDALLSAQAYRLSHWKAASDEVNYRRFFDVNGLAAVCMESIEVFQRTHRLVLDLLSQGDLDGLRIDHIDGLYDPTQYLWRLQWSYLRELAELKYRERRSAALPQENGGTGEPAGPENSSISRAAAVAPPETTLASFIDSPGGGEPTFVAETAESLANPVAEAPPPFPAWEDVRPLVLDQLCDRLQLVRPGPTFLSGTSEYDMASGRIRPEPAPAECYTKSVAGAAELPLYVVVEKILGPEEPLPDNWPVAGTSGYDFLHLLNGVFLDKHGVAEIENAYFKFIGERLEFSEIVYRSKLLILRVAMSSELQMLSSRLNRISEQHRKSRDFTLNSLRHALREILAYFPVYRTYPGPAGVTERDRKFVHVAIAQAKRRNPAIDPAVFDFIRSILLLEHPDELSEEARRERELFAGRFQQVTSPVMAKGVEDTSFYIYCPLVSMNEVGSHPDAAVVPLEHFHHDNLERHERWPQSMLATSTHDTKRSQDVRARISVLCEVPHLWRKAVNNWTRMHKRLRHEVDGQPAPSRNDEYLFYQTLVGMWPTEPPKDDDFPELASRLQAYMEKATREAKVRTSWINPNTAYDETVRQFVAAVLSPTNKKFLTEFQRFLDTVLDWGMYSALSQVTLKLLSPGVPDVYQGQELWDYSLVDPDNRRPVDYALRQQWLEEIDQAVQAGPDRQRALAQTLGRIPRDPRLKLLTTSTLLKLRRDEAELFSVGKYVPLEVQGNGARNVCAFAWTLDREGETRGAIVVAPRFLASLTAPLERGPRQHLLDPATWANTQVMLDALPAGAWRNVFTGATQDLPQGSVAVSDLLVDFPVAVLVR